MTAVSSEVAEKARKFSTLAFHTISRVGQNTVAERIGLSGSTVHRFVTEDLDRACQVLAAAGLKIVPTDMKCYPKAQIDAILTLARERLNQVDDVEQLSFEE